MRKLRVQGITRLYFDNKKQVNYFLALLKQGLNAEEMCYYLDGVYQDDIGEGRDALYADLRKEALLSNKIAYDGLDDYCVYMTAIDKNYTEDNKIYDSDDILCIVHAYTHGELVRIDTTYNSGFWQL